ncbi:DmsC/YnfH family molybdoenzyme membrane anchor subunit [Alisedimentitalea sp. MJ-SS2]|uniref:dimethyl sulfoxide reductase anchor subunit family protein n=1 Tax=Aliisedimentitalea sp. MJ-SS2 TaxID=3049795 RepID=UPI0029098D8D|nr:DmsC/YnfH family molybdoenzyme membrane anchor subunit [Alisedimentitalea sp. MJ-SS2]MDU8926211.1 DmsC/YnfH family molybdoenzyme membrane anchor subunit [Alisedimentitalea sp. MJ-SS2]
MHPAPSVILFTAFSGLGFGLLAFLGLGLPPVGGMTAFVFYLLGYGMAVGGLLASTFHLGNKKNAIKAFSQWRSSWLSREGIMAVLTLLVMAPYAFEQVFLDTMRLQAFGILGAIFALITVFTTSMIYTQLKTVPRWNTPLTPIIFLLFALAGGAMLSNSLKAAAAFLIALGALQIIAWMQGDAKGATGDSTLETATGLGRIGKTRLLEPPHSGQNYLLHEMAYDVGRKHALKLRVIALLCAVVIPVLIIFAFPVGHMMGLLMIVLHLIGLLAARWLFFAEAAHVVRLYYGK